MCDCSVPSWETETVSGKGQKDRDKAKLRQLQERWCEEAAQRGRPVKPAVAERMLVYATRFTVAEARRRLEAQGALSRSDIKHILADPIAARWAFAVHAERRREAKPDAVKTLQQVQAEAVKLLADMALQSSDDSPRVRNERSAGTGRQHDRAMLERLIDTGPERRTDEELRKAMMAESGKTVSLSWVQKQRARYRPRQRKHTCP
jgi:hypothetical protein